MEKTFTAFLHQNLFQKEQTEVEEGVFADIFDRYYQRIYNYMRYRLGNPDDAEELTSQVFEQVVRKIKTFYPERAPFEVWIFAIAHHAVSDYYRRRRRWQWFSLESIRDLVSRQSGPEETAIKKEGQIKLLTALESLADRERNIIAMKFAGGLKNREIARLTGLSESNVGVIIYRALHQLRGKLESEEWDYERG